MQFSFQVLQWDTEGQEYPQPSPGLQRLQGFASGLILLHGCWASAEKCMFQSLISHVTKQKLPPAHQWLQKHIQVSELPFIIICKKTTDKDQTATCSYCPPVSMSSVMLKELCRVRYSMSQTCFSTVSILVRVPQPASTTTQNGATGM